MKSKKLIDGYTLSITKTAKGEYCGIMSLVESNTVKDLVELNKKEIEFIKFLSEIDEALSNRKVLSASFDLEEGCFVSSIKERNYKEPYCEKVSLISLEESKEEDLFLSLIKLNENLINKKEKEKLLCKKILH